MSEFDPKSFALGVVNGMSDVEVHQVGGLTMRTNEPDYIAEKLREGLRDKYGDTLVRIESYHAEDTRTAAAEGIAEFMIDVSDAELIYAVSELNAVWDLVVGRDFPVSDGDKWETVLVSALRGIYTDAARRLIDHVEEMTDEAQALAEQGDDEDEDEPLSLSDVG